MTDKQSKEKSDRTNGRLFTREQKLYVMIHASGLLTGFGVGLLVAYLITMYL